MGKSRVFLGMIDQDNNTLEIYRDFLTYLDKKIKHLTQNHLPQFLPSQTLDTDC